MRPPLPDQRQRTVKAAAACAIVLASFVTGAMTQRVENALALEDHCSRAADGIACLILVSAEDDGDEDEPPQAGEEDANG